MFFNNTPEDPQQLETLAKALQKGISSLIRERSDGALTVKATMERKRINEFMRKMRVDSIDKFVEPAFVSTVNYYLTEQDMIRKKTLGALVIYVEEHYVPILLRSLKYPTVDSQNDDALKDACGTLVNIMAGRFKNEMLALGFTDLEMSPFSNYRKSALMGVDFDHKQTDKYDITFFINENKRLVVELTMGPVPKKK